MKRRIFSAGLAATASTLAAGSAIASTTTDRSDAHTLQQTFKHNYAPHDGMFASHAGKDFVEQIKYMHSQGFRGIEDNGMLKRSKEEQDKIATTLSKLGMTLGVFVVDGGDNWKISLTTGKQEFKDNFIKTCKQSVELAKRVNAKWMTVVPGFYERNLPIGVQTGNVIDALRMGAEIFEPHGLVMVLEPLSDTPDLFLRYSDQTYEICRAVNSPACKFYSTSTICNGMRATLFPILKNAGMKLLISGWRQPGRKEPTRRDQLQKYLQIHLDKAIAGYGNGTRQRQTGKEANWRL